MKILTTTGFYGTGSSAITDLFSEMNNVCVKGDYEFRIFIDPDGISDLEYNLIDNANRHNTSNAIKRYIKQAKFLNGNAVIKRYNKFFGNKFLEETYKYIDQICEFKYKGIWYFDIYERGTIFWFFSRCYSKINLFLHRIVDKKYERQKSLISENELSYAGTYNRNKFINATKRYTNELCRCFNNTNSEYVMLDQLVPPTNLKRYVRYFEDIVVYIVDRDPRDLYLLEKIYWKGKTLPVYDVKIFVEWYAWTRGQYELFELPENAIKIQFEDMIYKYDETIETIMSVAGIHKEHHILKKKAFNPNISINNTHLWIKHPEYENDIKYIEEKLSKYCYSYE